MVRLTIKAYVVDVRLERVMASDITERTLEALAVQRETNGGSLWLLGQRQNSAEALDS
ncbi:hypothetical protein [Denitromonas sp.]|uniref:hypothetical protein n=1 Tax=Denitromonas sp. TaxID=2734609 RepID=UPI003A84C5C8